MFWCFFKKSFWSFKLYIESKLQSREPFSVWSDSSRGRRVNSLYSLEEHIFLYSLGCEKVLDSILKMSTFFKTSLNTFAHADKLQDSDAEEGG